MPGGRVLIAGGGMVGLAFAIALKTRLGQALSIELIESRALPSGDPDGKVQSSEWFLLQRQPVQRRPTNLSQAPQVGWLSDGCYW